MAALLDDKILCIHGGLSKEMEKVEKIKKIIRPTNVQGQGLLCYLLRSDTDENVNSYGENDRGVSVVFKWYKNF